MQMRDGIRRILVRFSEALKSAEFSVIFII
jgi:hypothetical protein